MRNCRFCHERGTPICQCSNLDYPRKAPTLATHPNPSLLERGRSYLNLSHPCFACTSANSGRKFRITARTGKTFEDETCLLGASGPTTAVVGTPCIFRHPEPKRNRVRCLDHFRREEGPHNTEGLSPGPEIDAGPPCHPHIGRRSSTQSGRGIPTPPMTGG